MKDYYTILGITDEERNLPEKEFQEVCSKKFRKISLQWHPDRWVNGTDEEKKIAEDKFKEYSEAKDVLMNPQKRQQYDIERNGGPQMHGFNPFDIFMRGNQNIVEKGEDVEVVVNLTFKEAYEGVTKEVNYKRGVKCHHCNGSGSEDGKKENCPHCNGSGWITNIQRNGNNMFQTSYPCPHCNGTGKIVKNPCKHCNGSGLEYIDCKETVEIPAGIWNGISKIIKGKGSSPKGEGINGNLIIEFDVAINSYFSRYNSNAVHVEKIPFNEALVGCEREIECPDGTKFTLKIPELTAPGAQFVKSGKGFNDPTVNNSVKGDYIITIEYIYPNKLTNKQKKLLKNFNND